MEDARATKARENRARRAAGRQGLTLLKSPRRDPRATGYGKWYLSTLAVSRAALGADDYTLTLDQVEARLDQPPAAVPVPELAGRAT